MQEYRKKGNGATARACADGVGKNAATDMVEAAYRIILAEDVGGVRNTKEKGKRRFFYPFALGFVSSALICALLVLFHVF